MSEAWADRDCADEDAEAYARDMLETKSGVGMTPPFYAETADVRGDPGLVGLCAIATAIHLVINCRENKPSASPGRLTY